jgi:hypothetical protein
LASTTPTNNEKLGTNTDISSMTHWFDWWVEASALESPSHSDLDSATMPMDYDTSFDHNDDVFS